MSPELLLAVRLAYLGAYAAVSVIDLRTRLIPNAITYPAIVAALLVRPDGIGPIPLGHLAAGAVAGLFFVLVDRLSLWLLKREGMGMGDAKLAVLVGLLSGPLLTPIAIWLAFAIGAAVSVVLILLKKKSRRDTIPFGPFLALGGAAVLLFGPELRDATRLIGFSL